MFKEWADWTDVPFLAITPGGSIRGETKDRLTTRDGRFAASEGFKAIDLWLAEEGLTDMALAQKGRWLVTTGSHGKARVWALTREDIIAESCSRLRRVGYSGQDNSGVEFTEREYLLRDACPEMRDIYTYIRR